MKRKRPQNPVRVETEIRLQGDLAEWLQLVAYIACVSTDQALSVIAAMAVIAERKRSPDPRAPRP